MVFLIASNGITAIDAKSSTYNLKCLIRLLHTKGSVSLPLACWLTRDTDTFVVILLVTAKRPATYDYAVSSFSVLTISRKS